MYITYVFSAEATKQLLVYLCFFFFSSLIFLKIRKDNMSQELRFIINLCSWALPIRHRQADVYDTELCFFLQ